jgi:hypothetical protein
MIRLEYLERADFKKIVEWNEGKSEEFLLQWAGPLYEYPLTISKKSLITGFIDSVTVP